MIFSDYDDLLEPFALEGSKSSAFCYPCSLPPKGM